MVGPAGVGAGLRVDGGPPTHSQWLLVLSRGAIFEGWLVGEWGVLSDSYFGRSGYCGGWRLLELVLSFVCGGISR